MNGNGPHFFSLSAPVFSTTNTTSHGISLISPVLHICGKLLYQTLLAPVCQTKGERLMSRIRLSDKGEAGGENNRTRWCEREEKKSQGVLLNMNSRGWGGISQSGANSCQGAHAVSWSGWQRVDKIQVEMKMVSQVGSYTISCGGRRTEMLIVL